MDSTAVGLLAMPMPQVGPVGRYGMNNFPAQSRFVRLDRVTTDPTVPSWAALAGRIDSREFATILKAMVLNEKSAALTVIWHPPERWS